MRPLTLGPEGGRPGRLTQAVRHTCSGNFKQATQVRSHIQYHAKSKSSFLMAAIVTINAINEINKELTLAVCLFLLIFCN
jgi:hypothetical protein